MKYNLALAIISGTIVTAIMTLEMFLAPIIGLPKMDIIEMLSKTVDGSIATGWVIHFTIGIFFAFIYILILNKKLPIENKIFRGMVFGFIIFLFAQVVLAIMEAVGTIPVTPGNRMFPLMFGSILGHFTYGASLGIIISKEKTPRKKNNYRTG